MTLKDNLNWERWWWRMDEGRKLKWASFPANANLGLQNLPSTLHRVLEFWEHSFMAPGLGDLQDLTAQSVTMGSNISFTGELLRNAEFWPPSRPTESESAPQQVPQVIYLSIKIWELIGNTFSNLAARWNQPCFPNLKSP